MSCALKVFLSAGEASGDRLGAGLARALHRLRPDAEILGMGGDEMAAAGVRLVRHASEVAVMGLVEVIRHLPALRRTLADLESTIARERPDVVVPVDFPDFNLRLAQRARRLGVPVVYFVSPQVWAWRPGRVRRIKPVVRRMLVLFPFETELYDREGIPVTFVGHPAAAGAVEAVDREVLLRKAGLDPSREVVALVPGSRRAEVARILPILLAAAAIVRTRRPDVQFVVTRAAALPHEAVDATVGSSGLPDTVVHAGDFPEILGACDAGAVASGTASLEAALAGLPMVVVYRLHPLTFALARRLVRVEHAALPNLIAGREVVPELLQGNLRAESLAEVLLGYLGEPGRVRAVREALAEVRRAVGKPDTFGLAARAVLEEIEPHAERLPDRERGHENHDRTPKTRKVL